MKRSSYWLLAGLMLLPASALAGSPVQLPEPGILELLATAGVVAAVIALRKRK